MQEDGTVLFMKSDGTYETAEQRDRRLAHNTRMQFNRSLESSSLEALMALWGKHISIYIYMGKTYIDKYLYNFICINIVGLIVA